MYSSFSQGYGRSNSAMGNLGAGIAGVQNKASGMIAKFRNNKVVSGTSEFLYSNSLVAKVCFLILVLILFVIALKLGTKFIMWMLSPSKNPILVNGLIRGRDYRRIHQNPNNKDAIPILRSVNEREGLEFTWSVWLWINDIGEPSDSRRRHIFNKGNSVNVQDATSWGPTNTNGMNFPNNGPGLYLSQKTNSLIVVMNTFSNVIEEVEIDDIPLNKWMNVILRCKGRNMDTYINGTIVNRHVFTSVPKQNYGDVFVNAHRGFDGMLSNLRYYSHALTGVEVENLVKAGPNLSADDSLKIFPPFLALRWFFETPSLANLGS